MFASENIRGSGPPKVAELKAMKAKRGLALARIDPNFQKVMARLKDPIVASGMKAETA